MHGLRHAKYASDFDALALKAGLYLFADRPDARVAASVRDRGGGERNSSCTPKYGTATNTQRASAAVVESDPGGGS